ncbi:reductase [Clostridia bacterium]|nr:reductase [Clostridia bacterium]
MISIDLQKCAHCGACADECLPGVIGLKEENPVIRHTGCMECGHCVSICPVCAISIEGYDLSELTPVSGASGLVDANDLMLFMKYQRSIRRFNRKVPGKSDIDALIEAGRYSPSGGNRQPIRYAVIENVPEIVELAMEAFRDIISIPDEGERIRAFGGYKAYVAKWTRILKTDSVTKEDKLFYGAPVVIVLIGNRKYVIDAGIAIGRMDLFGSAKGLSACMIGFFRLASEISPAVRQALKIQDGESVLATLAVGYSDVRYRTTKLRRKALVDYI